MKNKYACETTLVHEEAVSLVSGVMLPDSLFAEAADFFKIMGDKTRFRILYALDRQELCVCDLAILLDMSVSAVSHQLAKLRAGKLVKSRRDGKNIFYTIADDHIHMMLKGCVEHAEENLLPEEAQP